MVNRLHKSKLISEREADDIQRKRKRRKSERKIKWYPKKENMNVNYKF